MIGLVVLDLKHLLLYFMAIWCPVCIDEHSQL